ncbi:flavin-containing monooxygenase [Sphingobium nicotianae]|uniref:NAD(P)/FAD-dependent oxidoreductase n=1 Tax=Sphingobium nicotianae TaxID=2782607 RepID=A0A9X1DDE6_9SPHN|nr:NAD(P)/FAD-dependent oxidoreductase [Sphingobium nicotianae]MBT2187834.1 NAD(P)/FAD-dependent oxidoreductase [Sphingobium nicotianae]
MTRSVGDWLADFEQALAAPAAADWSALFVEDSYWRDLVTMSWSIETLEGLDAIIAMIRAQQPAIKAGGFTLDDPSLQLTDENQGWFTFETATARARGHVQLEGGKARLLLTAIVELIGFEEPGGPRRPLGLEHKAAKGRTFWPDHRAEEEQTLGHTVQPYCLIIGGGQNGLQLAARLKRLGVPTLVVDALPRPGDCWRVRYKSLHLHDSIFMDHFPYLPFPDHWPLYTPAAKMGDWLELYAKAMELNIWSSTVCTGARYDEAAGEWTVTVMRDGHEITLKPKQFVLATGLSGAKNMPKIKGMERFQGTLCHSADHKARGNMAGKKVVVIGANNSAHDICTDMWEADADVTMVQRSPTIIVRAETMRGMADRLPYADPRIPTDFADLIMAVTPFRLQDVGDVGLTDLLKQLDADFYAALEKSGFMLSHGEDGTGFLAAYRRRASGYYIDVGGSELIINGEVKLAQGEITEITEGGLIMESGDYLPADIIVCATGYRPMNEFVGKLISPEVEHKVGRCWGLGSGAEGDPGPWVGELRNMWKPTAQEGLWFQGGNLMQSRFHSLHLALQIKARMEGLATPVYQPAAEKVAEPAE